YRDQREGCMLQSSLPIVGNTKGGWKYFFFFSSRRRHTRFSRDWSSDVCSSDLPAVHGGNRADDRPPARRGERGGGRHARQSQPRSEERRVGKECRSRWSTSP